MTDVVIPACNEASTIGDVIDACLSSLNVSAVFVIANGCTDDTYAVAREHGALAFTNPVGDKGTAMRQGLGLVNTERVLFVDADLAGLTSAHIDAMMTAPPLDGQLAGVTESVLTGLTKLLPPITGQRRLPTEFARTLALASSGYAAELRIDAAVGRAALPHKVVVLRGVTNPTRAIPSPWRFAKMTAAVIGASLYLAPELVAYERGGV